MSLNREGELSRETLSKMPASNWFVWAIYKSQWLTDGVRWFLPLLVLGLPLLIHLRLRLLSFLGDRQHLLGFLLVGGNTAMYLAAPEGHVVQMYYVFPLLIFLFCRLADRALQEPSLLPKSFFAPLTVTSLLVACFVAQPPFRWKATSADTTIAQTLAREIESVCDPEEKLMTFTPLLAAASRRRIIPGLEFETFNYFENLSTVKAKKFRLMNREILLDTVREEQPCAIHLDDRVLKLKGNAVRLASVQRELIDTIERHYQPVAHFQNDPARLLRGEAIFYIRR